MEVFAQVQLIIGYWGNISLPSLDPDNPTIERHILVYQSDYTENMRKFENGVKDKNLRMIFPKGDNSASLTDLP